MTPSTLKAPRRLQIGLLTVKVQPLAKPFGGLHQAMLNGIRDKGLERAQLDGGSGTATLRLLCAAKWLPEYDWPALMMKLCWRRWKRGCCHI
ncbi:hypothetical protein ACNKHT_00995 [Shigella flexneri]